MILSSTKKLWILQVEAKNSLQLASHLLNISKQVHDGMREGVEPSYWEVKEKKA